MRIYVLMESCRSYEDVETKPVAWYFSEADAKAEEYTRTQRYKAMEQEYRAIKDELVTTWPRVEPGEGWCTTSAQGEIVDGKWRVKSHLVLAPGYDEELDRRLRLRNIDAREARKDCWWSVEPVDG